jgi:Bacterial surface protein, Ig-like domain
MDQVVIDTTEPASYHINYVATDNSGNTATSTRTVIIQAANDNAATSATTITPSAVNDNTPTTATAKAI